MTTLPLPENWISPAVVRALGYALLHSLWQGAVLAGLLAAALPLLRRARPEVRYAASAAALAGLLLAVAGTGGYYWPAPAASAAPAPRVFSPHQEVVLAQVAATRAGAPAPVVALLPALARRAEPYLPVLVAAWLLGLLLMGGRLAGGLLVASRLRRAGTRALGGEWQRRLATLAARAGLRRPVALLESGRVRGPLVLGYLRPAILLPLGAVAGLPPALLEALLAHELAHIVRRDYLLNLALAVAEVLFFYHPAVWFMAACLRAERENCCDDQAAALCGGDRLRVARALAALAELEATAPAPRLALAAAGSGGRGSLLARVRRLALSCPPAPTLTEGLLAGLLGLLGVAGLGTGLALAAPLSRTTVMALRRAAASPADTTRRPGRAGRVSAAPAAPAAPAEPAAPVAPDAPAEPAAPAADADPAALLPTLPEAAEPADTPRTRRATGRARLVEQAAERRAASTIVLEKDKKGRVVSLSVDGQPVATDQPGQKARHGKKTSTVAIVQPAVPPLSGREAVQYERAMAGLGFSFSTDEHNGEARRAALQGLAESLRNPSLSSTERRAIERAQRSLAGPDDPTSFPAPSYRYRLDGKAEGLRRLSGSLPPQLRLNLNGAAARKEGYALNWPGVSRDAQQAQQEAARVQRDAAQAQRDAWQAQLDARQVQRDAAQAQLDAQQAQRDGQQALAAAREQFNRARAASPWGATRTAARRAQLEARIAAAEAELRALDAETGSPGGAGSPGSTGSAGSAGSMGSPGSAGSPGARSLRARVVPRPPQAPLAPAAPRAPQVPALPAPPEPPAGPTTQELREELRRDGLLGKNERNFSLTLNEKEMRVNGRVLPAAQAEKYRQLYNLPAGTGDKSHRTISITNSEK